MAVLAFSSFAVPAASPMNALITIDLVVATPVALVGVMRVLGKAIVVPVVPEQ